MGGYKNFKQFLLNEQTEDLAGKIGDVLTALQYLQQDGNHVGSRQIVRVVDSITDQFRQILDHRWSADEHEYLLVVQACGVALAKAIDTKQDIMSTVSGVIDKLKSLLSKIRK